MERPWGGLACFSVRRLSLSDFVTNKSLFHQVLDGSRGGVRLLFGVAPVGVEVIIQQSRVAGRTRCLGVPIKSSC